MCGDERADFQAWGSGKSREPAAICSGRGAATNGLDLPVTIILWYHKFGRLSTGRVRGSPRPRDRPAPPPDAAASRCPARQPQEDGAPGQAGRATCRGRPAGRRWRLPKGPGAEPGICRGPLGCDRRAGEPAPPARPTCQRSGGRRARSPRQRRRAAPGPGPS